MTAGLKLESVKIAGLDRAIELRRSPRARRLSLQADAAAGVVRLVAPPGVTAETLYAFALRHAGWIQRRIDAMPPRTALIDGATVPFRGMPHVIRHDPSIGRVVRRLDGALAVGGEADFLGRRVRDWFRDEARRELARQTRERAADLGRPVRAITIRDTRSRWGSCGPDGRISYSWRLILAPESVLGYVVAHEVAHLVELNHSRRFWRLVEGLDPDWRRARDWLKAHGPSLHRIG